MEVVCQKETSLYVQKLLFDTDSRQTEDMDISPGSTPSNSRPGSRPSSRISTPITSTPGASATPKVNF